MILLIIDTQKLITNKALYNYDMFVSNIKKLIEAARKNNIEVVYVRHDDGAGRALTKGAAGYEICDGFKPLEDEKIFDKTVNSAFKETGLTEYLKGKRVKDIIIAGLQTDFCIDANVKSAFENGFHVIVPAYANTTTDNAFMTGEDSYRYYNEYMWKNRYARCITVEETMKLMEDKVNG